MARSSVSQSPESSLAGKTTLDSELPDGAAAERPNRPATDGDLEDGEISEDAKSPVQAPPDGAPTQLPAIAEAPPLSEPGGPQPPADAIPGDESRGQAQPPPPSPHHHPPSEISLQESVLAPSSDPTHNRALSDEELDHAKSLVLDLLGWGVEPEYLVEVGVSSPVLYRIFTDLHLRLPTNLAYFN